FALLISPLSSLSGPWQASAWFAVSALMCFGIYFECRRLLFHACYDQDAPAEAGTPAPDWIMIAAAVTAVLPALNCLQRGQMGVALLYPLLLGFRLVVTGRTKFAWLLGGAVLALPIALKLTPLLPAACVLFVCVLIRWSSAIRRRVGHEKRLK